MAGEQKRKRRETWVAKALLLGYTFKGHEGTKFIAVFTPEGEWVDNALHRAMYKAACAALNHAGVSLDVPRETKHERQNRRDHRSI
jgi:hypothetical protein